MLLKELTNEEFRTFSKNFNLKSIYQTVEYAFVMNKQNFDCVLLGLCDDSNNIVAASLFLIDKNNKYKCAYCPRGYLIDYNNFNLLNTYTKEIKKYFNKRNIISIKISPLIIKNAYDVKYNVITKNNYYDNIFHNLKKLGYKHLGYNNFFEGLKPRYEAIIDLNVPYYILFKNISKNFRTKIRSAEKRGIKVYKGNVNDLEYLYLQTKESYPRDLKYFQDCYKHFSVNNQIEFFYTKLDTAAYLECSQQLYQEQERIASNISYEISNNLKRNNKKLVNKKIDADKLADKYKQQLIEATNVITKYPEGIVTASALVIKNSDEVFLLMDGYNKEYKNLNSKQLLIWKLCERYAKEGFKKFNLGGITGLNISDNQYQGLNDFKINFNALAVEYIGDLELITNNTQYFIEQSIKSILKK